MKNMDMLLSLMILLAFVRGFDQQFNMNDILNQDYLPGTLLQENALSGAGENGELGRSGREGEFGDAIQTMAFHRKMMNEYLCRSYLAEEILSDMSGQRVDKRSGQPRADTDTQHPARPFRVDLTQLKEGMLDDSGSSNYQKWLSRHYGASREDVVSPRHGHESEPGHEFEGEVTGYAMQPAHPSGFHHSYHADQSKSSGGGGYDGGPANHAHHHHPHHPHHQPADQDPYESWPPHHHEHRYPHPEKEEKGMAIKDLFELALTALAFLAFKIFLLNVIMCFVSNNNGNTTTMVNIPALRNRTLRSSGNEPSDSSMKSTELNDMARKVLTSMDAFRSIHQDNGACLQRSLCENNRYSRKTNERQQLWLPIWSLGASYVGGKLARGVTPATLMLENLRASVLGLGSGHCGSLYPACRDRPATG